jgi:hypothetical protein
MVCHGGAVLRSSVRTCKDLKHLQGRTESPQIDPAMDKCTEAESPWHTHTVAHLSIAI